MADNLTLPFGCNKGVPENVELAWGARWIVQSGGYMDQLPDRMGIGVRGDMTDNVEGMTIEMMKSELIDYLNTEVKMQPRENARRLYLTGKLNNGDGEVVTIFDDPKCKMVASLQQSHGYCYVAAWLKAHVTLTDDDVKEIFEAQDRDEIGSLETDS